MPAQPRFPRLRRRPALVALAATATTAAALGGLLSFTPTASAGELVTNGGFENGLTGWSCSAGAQSAVGTAKSGSRSLKATPSASDIAKCTQKISVSPNTDYTFSVHVRGSYVYAGVEGGAGTWTAGTNGSYQRLNVRFRTGGSQTSAKVYLHGWYGQSAYHADDASVGGPGGNGEPNPDPTTKPPTNPPTKPPATGSAVAANGQLKVCGTKLCNKNRNPVQLRGMSTHGTQWYSQCVTNKSLDALAKDWGSDVLRVSTYVQEGGYETDPRKFTDLAHRLIEQASARGMYVIVDWHMLSPGDPYHNLSRAKTFFTEIASRHKNKPNVLYEIANEPSDVSWSRIKSYAEEIIPVIRAKDSDGVVLVGTRAWSSFGVSEGSDESEVVNNRVNASNIMYTFHFYAASHREEYLQALSRAADRIPVFVTEFGTQNYAGEEANDFAMAQRYLDLMAKKKISWVNWNFSDDHRSGAVFKTGKCATDSGWTGTSPLKEAGVWVRERIRTPSTF